MATFEDAASGWDIYEAAGGRVDRTQLNQALLARGFEPISERTYAHYRKLDRLGYAEYVSINRLDIRHSNDSVFDVADRARYLDRRLDSPGTLTVPAAEGLVTYSGSVVRVSEGYALLRVQNKEARDLPRAVKYNRGVLRFDQVGVERAVVAREALTKDDAVDLLLEFRSLLDTELLLPSSVERYESTLSANLGPEASIYSLLSAVHRTFDLLESTRSIIDVLHQVSSDEPLPLPTLRVRRLEFSNPLEVVLISAAVVLSGAGWVVKKVGTATEQGASAISAVQGVKHGASEEQRRDDRHEMEMAYQSAQLNSMQLDSLKKKVEIAGMIEALGEEGRQMLGIEDAALSAEVLERLDPLKDQAVEAAAELSNISDGTIDLTDPTNEGASESEQPD